MPLIMTKIMKEDYTIRFSMQHEQYKVEYTHLDESQHPYAKDDPYNSPLLKKKVRDIIGMGSELESITDSNFAKLMNKVLKDISAIKNARFCPEFAKEFPTEETNLVVKLFLIYNQSKQ